MKKIFLALIATAALSLAEATALSSAEQEDPGISRLQSECDSNNTLACVNLAMAYYSGDGVKQDYEKARELNFKACSLGDGWGCTTLGASYEYGKGAKQD
uniref:tetratricopeptide repeat protein n=1 Tax=uncultured Campylobacter sp. TaxID=218934 RepID=UPI00261D5B3E